MCVTKNTKHSTNMNEFKLAHISDTHIGYEAYKSLSAKGENQRSVDFARAFANAVDDIIAADPPLVIHSGDVADRTVIPVRLMLFIKKQFSRLAGVRTDGSFRQVVIVAGNHELPRNRKEACFLELLYDMENIHLATTDYTVIDFSQAGSPSELKDTLVHCVPHDALKSIDFDKVTPVEDKINIFSSHGVAGGSELYVRSLGREFHIPTTVLSRDWDYGALGHWHKQGPVTLGKGGNGESKIWYAGSTENCGFGDLKDNGQERGWLEVSIKKGSFPKVKRRNLPTRSMFRLPIIDGSGLSPTEVTEKLIDNIKNADMHHAIVGQIVENVSRENWGLVDMVKVKKAAESALHYDVTVKLDSNITRDTNSQLSTSSEARSIIKNEISKLDTSQAVRSKTLDLAINLFEEELAKVDLEKDSAKASGKAAKV